nr:putative ribonuclease H-like domain-containing protein [Tanacetum cinerariifolium]
SNPQQDLQDKGVIDSGCSRHMTGNMPYLTYYKEIDGGYVAFGGNPKGEKITCRVNDGLGPQEMLILLPNVQGNPQQDLQDKGVIDSGCSRHMTGNMSYLTYYKEIDGGYVAFGGNPKGEKITCR